MVQVQVRLDLSLEIRGVEKGGGGNDGCDSAGYEGVEEEE